MAYNQGGVIAASDFNNFLNGANQFNSVWSTGSGNSGYGQTAVGVVAGGNLVAATNWNDLVTKMNAVSNHQAGNTTGMPSASGLVVGQPINYISTVSTAINTLYTNRLNAASRQAVTTGAALTTAWSSASTAATVTGTWGARCAFSSADAARYFFNAGGQLKFNVSAPASASTTARTNEIAALAGFLGGVQTFASTTNGGRTGTGGTLNTNDTTKGYWTTTYNTNTTLVSVTSTTANYTSDTGSIYVNLNGLQGSNGGNGLNVDFYMTLSSLSGPNGPGGTYSYDDSFSNTITRSIDVYYPLQTYLTTASWGTVNITAL